MILILVSLLASCISVLSLNEDSVVLRNVSGQNEDKPDKSTCLPQDIRLKAFDIEFMTIETEPETIIFNGLLLPIKSCSSLMLLPNHPATDDHPSTNGTILCFQTETLNHNHSSFGMTDVLIYSLYNCTRDEDMTLCKYHATNGTKPIALTSFLQSQIKEIDNTKHNASQQVYEIKHDLNEASCEAFDVSIFAASITIIIRSINDSNVTIEDPNGIITALSVTSSETMLYGMSCPIAGEWSICSNGIGLNISLIISTDFPFTVKFVDESLSEVASTTTSFACDVQTVVLDLKYHSLVSMNRDIQFSTMHSTTDTLTSTIIKQHNGMLYGSMKLPVHHKFFYQLSGIDIKGNPFTSSTGDYTLDLQYADIQFSLVGSQTILLNPGVKSLVRLFIRNNGKGPIVIPLLLQVNTSETISVDFPKGHEISIKPNTDYEHHVFLTPAIDSPLELEYSTDVTFTVSSECIQENLSYSFHTVTRNPVDMIITNITTTSMILHWEEPTLLSAVIHYLISFDFSNGTKATIQLDDRSILTYTVNGLQPNQLLYTGIIANTGVVNEFAGIIPRPVRTLPTVPESVASISREILSQFTASVFWSDPPSNVDRILFYHIVLYRNGRRNVTIVINGSTNTLNLTDLLPFKEYLVTIKAENIAGIGASRNITFYTKEGVPGMPVGLAATALLPTAIHVTWRPPPIEMRRGIITGYELSVSEHGNSTIQIMTLSSDVWTIIVSRLKVFSNATILLSAVTSVGVGPAAITNVLLTSGVPSPPRNFQGAFVNDTSVIFYWRAPRQPNGYILGYFFHLEWQNEDNSSRIMIEEIPPTLSVFGTNYHEYLLANMLPGEYKVYITAMNWLGNGTKSSTIIFEIANITNESDDVSFPTLFTLMFVLSFLVILSGVLLLLLLSCLLWKERKRVVKKVFQAGTKV